jgi:hypothetical protein
MTDTTSIPNTLYRLILTLSVLALFLPAYSLFAQTSTDKDKDKDKNEKTTNEPATIGVSVDSSRKSADLPNSLTTETNPGVNAAGYEIKQTIELGGRLSDFTGNPGTWDTFVNLGTGPRLLEYSLDMHSPTHTGLFWDDLSFTNFGYGGDPNNASHLRMQKGKYYNFNVGFRRDQNIFDYDLLANPLNPSTSNPNVPILQSPHEILTTRRMTDVNLSLFPVSKIRLRLGWSHVVNEGSAFSSTHQGTEGLLFSPTLNTTDNYSFGISLRLIPRTSLNYDQFYTYFKGDTVNQLATPAQGALFGIPSFTLAGGIPVSLGIPFNTPAGQPCATPVLGTGFVNPACNGYFSYSSFGRTRNSFPTEQVSFQSNYFRPLDVSARFGYTDAEASDPSFAELFNGLTSRTRQRNFQTTGGSLAHRISLTGDLGLTYRVTDRFRIVDNFRLNNFRIPSSWNFTTASLFGATLLSNPNVFTPATCPPPFTAATCPQHSASSGADIDQNMLTEFLRQDQRLNTIELEYDFTRRISGHVGYRYEWREITHTFTTFDNQTFFPTLPNRGACAGLPLNSQGVCTVSGTDPARSDSFFVPIQAHSLLLGFNARPTDALRLIFDTELYYADNAYTRISPRHLQSYRFRGNYKRQWFNFGTAITIFENRNNGGDIGNLQHNRSYAFNTVITPPEAKWGLDFSYNYNDIFSATNICFVATPTTPGTVSCGAPFLSGVSTYTDTAHNVSGSVYLKPIPRVTAAVGYTLTSTNGNTLILNPIAPTGPLAYNYYLPSASLAIQLSRQFTYKTGWNYYDYNEKSLAGPTFPRDFRGNTFTLSLRYSM